MPFTVQLTRSGQWGAKPLGQLAVPNAEAAGYAAGTLDSFVHGTAHSELRVPFRLSAWFTNSARLVMHLNSVSDGAVLTVRVDGVETYRTNLPNLEFVHDNAFYCVRRAHRQLSRRSEALLDYLAEHAADPPVDDPPNGR